MTADPDGALQSIMTRIAQYIEDAAELRVETRCLELSADGPVDFTAARPVAQTVVKLDADSIAVVPVRRTGPDTVEPDVTLLELHQRSVQIATEYRSCILSALLDALQARLSLR